MKKVIAVLTLTLLCATPLLAQQHHSGPNSPAPVHNGPWWKEKSSIFKEAFIAGYKAGSEHVAGHLLDINKFPGSELIPGLDSFYKDFRNSGILIDDALTYVEDQMRGIPDDKLNAELLKMRAAAAPAASVE
jgi:hypothetical protein